MSRQGLRQVNAEQRRRSVARLSLLWAGALLAAALGGCGAAPPQNPVSIRNAYVQLPAVSGRPGIAYFRVETATDPMRLAAVGSPGLGRVELHGSMTMDGMASMAPLGRDALLARPGLPLIFAPGGKHAMIYDMPDTLRPGARIPMTFTFKAAPPITVWADVRAVGADQ